MRHIIHCLLCVTLLAACGMATASASTRAERRLVSKGNKLYTEHKFVEAASIYEQALKENPQSTSAIYNLGLAQLRQVTNPADSTPKAKALIENARKNLTEAASRAKTRPGIAAKANYNLGNLEFNTNQFEKAIQYYKQALRIDPNDNNARRNLRIAQKKLQQQKQDKQQNQQQKQDQQKQDQQKQNKDQQKQDQNKEQQKQPKDQEINQQTAERILQAVDNKENQTRARVNRASRGEKSGQSGRAVKRW